MQLVSDICLNLTNGSDFSDLRQIHFWQSNMVLIILISLSLLSNVVLIIVPWSVSTNLDQFVFLIKPLAIVPVWRARYGLEPEINISVVKMFKLTLLRIVSKVWRTLFDRTKPNQYIPQLQWPETHLGSGASSWDFPFGGSCGEHHNQAWNFHIWEDRH